MRQAILIAMLLITGYSKMLAQVPDIVLSDKPGWHKIGETTVDFKTDTDEILILGANRFHSIKMKVTDAPIHFVSFIIYFESGDNQMVKIGENIKKAGETREIALSGGDERSVKKIVLTYKTVPNSKDEKAHLELWGLKTNTEKKK